MGNPIRARFPALSLVNLHDLCVRYRDEPEVLRLLWEIRALHAVVRDARQLETEHHFAYPDTPEGQALLQLRASLMLEAWLGEKPDPGRPLTREEKQMIRERRG